MNILVIGNGFDLAHHLKTKYADFLHFINSYRSYNSGLLKPDAAFYEEIDELKNRDKDHFEEINTLIQNNKWITYFLNILDQREKEDKTGWIDFESEISVVIQELDKNFQIVKGFESRGKTNAAIPYEAMQHSYLILHNGEEHAKGEYVVNEPKIFYKSKDILLNDLNRLIRCLEIYLAGCVKAEDNYKLPDIEGLEIDHVISFNYTDTYKQVYHPSDNVKYNFIHGKANINGTLDDCNLVLGIDEYLDEPDRTERNDFIEFKKFYQRIYKMTGSEYRAWLDQRRKFRASASKYGALDLNIYIFGHSLDVTDKDILRDLILEEGAMTTIFYHDKKDLGDKIAHLVKVIGEEELISRTGTEKSSIKFQLQRS